MICFKKDCGSEAKYQVNMQVWAKGYSKSTTPPAILKTDIKLCAYHKANFKKDEMLNDQGMDRLRAIFRFNGYAEPDFKTAEIGFKEI